jgi:hypothetical protein
MKEKTNILVELEKISNVFETKNINSFIYEIKGLNNVAMQPETKT